MKTTNCLVPGVVLLSCITAVEAIAAETEAYQGEITSANNRDFFDRMGNRKVDHLVISSMGGDVEAGIDLGLWVHRQQLTLEVRDSCFSSCANYVFTAAARKIIRPGAVVAWHGNYHHLYETGLWRDDIPKRMRRTGESRAIAKKKVREQVQHLVTLEKSFFRTIGVDQYLCWIGKMPPYSAGNYYFMSAADMARFGVKQVQVPEDYAKTDTRKYEVLVEFIRLGKE